MQSIRQSLAASAIMLLGANAFELSMDPMHQAPQVSQDDGLRSSVTLAQKFAPISSFKMGKESETPARSLYKQGQELLFGKSFEDQYWEQSVTDVFAKAEQEQKKRKTRGTRHHLRQTGQAQPVAVAKKDAFDQKTDKHEHLIENLSDDTLTYHGPIYIGADPKTEASLWNSLNVVYDTGSDWLVVEGKECTRTANPLKVKETVYDDQGVASVVQKETMMCQGSAFDPTKAGSTAKATGKPMMKRRYGSVQFTGSTYKDKVCLMKDDWCANDFEFFVASTAQNLNASNGLGETLDGILGLSRSTASAAFKYTPQATITSKMKDPRFSFYLKTFKTEYNKEIDPLRKFPKSMIDFGAPDTNKMQGNELDVVNLKLNNDFYWSSQMKGIRFGKQQGTVADKKNNAFCFAKKADWKNTATKSSAQRKTMYSIFDTGTSFTLIPASYWKSFNQQVIHHFGIKTATIRAGVMAFNCKEVSDFKSIYFMFEAAKGMPYTDYWLEAHPNDYIFKISDTSEKYPEGMCAFAMRKNQAEFFVMGNTFLRGYYAMFSPSTVKDAASLGFINQDESVKGTIEAGNVPTEYLAEEQEQVLVTWIIIATAMAGWTVGMTWGIAPLVKELDLGEFGSWADILIDSGLDGAFTAGMFFFLRPALNNALSENKIQHVDSLDPTIQSPTQFMAGFVGLSAARWSAKRFKANKDNQNKDAQAAFVKEVEPSHAELMDSLSKMVNKSDKTKGSAVSIALE